MSLADELLADLESGELEVDEPSMKEKLEDIIEVNEGSDSEMCDIEIKPNEMKRNGGFSTNLKVNALQATSSQPVTHFAKLKNSDHVCSCIMYIIV